MAERSREGSMEDSRESCWRQGQVARDLQIGRLWPGIGNGCQGTHGPTAALLS